MERGDILEIIRLSRQYMQKAEQTRGRALEAYQRYDEVKTKLDKLRRKMVFVENGTPGSLELVSAMLELEELRENRKNVENKLRSYLTASLSSILSCYQFLDDESISVINQMSIVLRQAVMLIRTTRELNLDLCNIYGQILDAKILVTYKSKNDKRIPLLNHLRYLNQIMSSLE